MLPSISRRSLKKLATGFQVCDGANALQFGVFQLNRRMRWRLYAATGVLSLAMWLLLALIILLALEVAVAFWLAHLRRAATPAVIMEPGIRA